jgi:hypothetical protein
VGVGDSRLKPFRRPLEVKVHAVVVRVTVNDREAAEQALRDQVVPQVSQAPGFVNGYWTWKDDTGLSMAVFQSEEAATAAAERVPAMIPGAVTLEGVEVREVVAHA